MFTTSLKIDFTAPQILLTELLNAFCCVNCATLYELIYAFLKEYAG